MCLCFGDKDWEWDLISLWDVMTWFSEKVSLVLPQHACCVADGNNGHSFYDDDGKNAKKKAKILVHDGREGREWFNGLGTFFCMSSYSP